MAALAQLRGDDTALLEALSKASELDDNARYSTNALGPGHSDARAGTCVQIVFEWLDQAAFVCDQLSDVGIELKVLRRVKPTDCRALRRWSPLRAAWAGAVVAGR
jgi:hypothetical protein